MLDVAIVYALGQFPDTALSANAEQMVRCLKEQRYSAKAITTTSLCPKGGGSQDWEGLVRREKPRIIIVSAYILPIPEMERLANLSPETIWVQRVHSNLAWLFLCGGDLHNTVAAIEMTRRVRNVRFAFVSPDETARWQAAGCPNVVCVPNVYMDAIADEPRTYFCEPDWLHLSAVFAVRWMKAPGNHILAASIVHHTLRPAKLHIQTERSDSPSQFREHMKRLANLCGLRIPEEPYRPRQQFLDWVRDHIDIGLQLSMTESFNYVAMEHLASGVPVVVSDAIGFGPWRCRYEDAQAAAAQVALILEDYPQASDQALACARTVADRQRDMFLTSIRSLIGD